MSDLPALSFQEMSPTRDYLQDVAKVLGKLQQAFLPVDPHDWQRGLVVNTRGLSTQTFHIAEEEVRASIDLVARKVRLDGSKWLLEDYDAPEIMNNVRSWIENRGLQVHLEEPQFSTGKSVFKPEQSDNYAQALWWMDEQFRAVQSGLVTGEVSPILLFPHHFDLSLTWFPHGDDRQLSLGWSTGDENIAEPYAYITAYPELAGFTKLPLLQPAYWHQAGFSGAVLLYGDLVRAENPERLFAEFAGLFTRADLAG